MRKCMFLFVASLAACASIDHGVITDMGSPDTYKLALKGQDSLQLYENIVEQADSFCESKGLYFMPAAKNYNESSYEMIFRCLSAGDPELIQDDKHTEKKQFHKKLGGYGDISY